MDIFRKHTMAAYPSFLNMNKAGVLVPSPWIGLMFVALPLQAYYHDI